MNARLDALLAESATATTVDAEARIQRLPGGGYRLKLQLHVGSRHAERRLDSESCDELATTAAWLIALAIDPTVHDDVAREGALAANAEAAATAGSDEAQEGGPANAVPANAPVRPREAPAGPALAREPASDGRSRLRASLAPVLGSAAALLGVSFGTAGAAQAELGGAGGLGFGWLYSELALSVLLPHREELAAGGAVTSWSLDFGLRECALWGARMRWGPCLTVDGLRTVGHAQGLSAAQPDQVLFWAVAGAALRVVWNVRGRLELSLSGGLGLPISPRPRFTVEGVGEVAPVSALPAYLRIGVGTTTRSMEFTGAGHHRNE